MSRKRWGAPPLRTLSAHVVAVVVVVFFQALSALSAFAAFDELGAGARGPGLGNAFTPIADDVYALHYNPAGLGQLQRPMLGTSYTSLFPGLRDSSALTASFIGYAQPLKDGRRGTLGLSWESFSLDTLYREDTLTLGYGRRAGAGLGSDLHLGVNAKYLRTSLGSVSEASNAIPTNGVVGTGLSDPSLRRRSRGAVSADLGLLQRFGKHYSLGAALINVNQPDVSLSGSGQSKVPMGTRVGVNYGSLISNVVAQVETQAGPTGKRDIAFTTAAERWFPKLFTGEFGLRGAMTLGTRDLKEASLGLSYRTHRFEADYAMNLPVGGVASTFGSHRVALNFRFGRNTEDEESMELVLEAMKQLKTGQAVASTKGRKQASSAERATLGEYLAQARGLEARARYAEALEKMRSALMMAPADSDVINHQQRLAFVAPMIKNLPDYKSDPAQASLHLGIIAYFAGNDLEAVKKVSEALAQKPDHRALDAFLTQLETATGVKRTMFAAAKRPDYQAAVNLTRANAAIEDGDYEKAIELSLAVVRVEPNSAAAWQNLGTAYFAIKDYDASLKSWQRAYDLEKSPALRSAIKNTMRSITRAKEQSHAVAKPRSAAPQPPERPRLSVQESQNLFNEAVDHYTRREFVKAKDLLQRLLEGDPDNVEAQKALKRVKDELP